MTVVTVRPDGTRKDSEAWLEKRQTQQAFLEADSALQATFDTMRAGSDALATYIDGIEDGTMVLIGARDEAREACPGGHEMVLILICRPPSILQTLRNRR